MLLIYLDNYVGTNTELCHLKGPQKDPNFYLSRITCNPYEGEKSEAGFCCEVLNKWNADHNTPWFGLFDCDLVEVDDDVYHDAEAKISKK